MDGSRAPSEVRTTCPYCGVGCGVVVRRDAGGISVAGDPRHPANFGRLCSKGSALAETIDLSGRLLSPVIEGRIADWDSALGLVADRFLDIVRRHGPDSVAFYVSGQLLTEDYYVVNKLAKGFLGTANVDTNSRLCMASSVAGHRRAFGADVVPGSYADLEQAELIVLVGSNAAWCHPVLYQRMLAAKEKNPQRRIIVIDPRRTETCEGADLHLPLRSGSDAVLFNGLLAHLARVRAGDGEFIASHASGTEAALAAARESAGTAARTAAICGLSEGQVHLFFDWFTKTKKVVTLYSQGINQSSSGTDKVNAILNCHLYTGRIGLPGMGPFSLTGQPNAMGGREVGGLANQLAAHLELEDPAHRDLVRRFWRSPVVADHAGLKAVDLFGAVAAGRVKALWVMSTNPAVTLPNADAVRGALAACDFLVVSDCMRETDTTRFADVVLPAATWGERAGTVTNSERRLSRQRPFLAPAGNARPDWWIVTQVARRMGFGDAFRYETPADIFREHARLSGFENGPGGVLRAFDIAGLADLTDAEFEALEPLQWPVPPGTRSGTERLFGGGGFLTADRRARLVPVTPRPPKHATSREYPLSLNTGRVRDHWHTMTRTGKSPRLSGHSFEPVAELHPDDAGRRSIADGSLVRLRSEWGVTLVRARVTPAQRRGCVYVPMHWNAQFASGGRVNALVNPALDPVSGQPELKHTPVQAEPYGARWQATLLSRDELPAPAMPYWVRGRLAGGWRHELAAESAPPDFAGWARGLLRPADGDEWMEYLDRAAGRMRCAVLRAGRLAGVLFAGAERPMPALDWLSGLLAADTLTPSDRAALLAGRPPGQAADNGPTVCACMSVGARAIERAIRAGCATVDAIGAATNAGTSCGSCRPELAKMLRLELA